METNKSEIPTTLDEALDLLLKKFTAEDLETLKRTGVPPWWHLGGGMAVRNEWGLWRGSALAQQFKALGIFHADDMSGIIMESLVRKLRGEPLDVPGQVKYYQAYWAKQSAGKKKT